MNDSDFVTQTVEIQAPVEKVWSALTNHIEFGTWFQVKLDQAFEPGKESTGHMTISGFEHVQWEAEILEMRKPTVFSFSGPPYVEDTEVDLAKEPWLKTVFTLSSSNKGSAVTVVESGFDALSPSIRSRARAGNKQGWEMQMNNLTDYIIQNS